MENNWKTRFWCIFAGQSLSMIGSSLTQFVLLWWIADTVGSVNSLATAGMAALLPNALLSPLGGVLADRYSRKLLMMISDAVSALCMVVLIYLFLTNQIELYHAYIMMAIRGAMQAFQAPAAAASMAMLVPESFLTRAAGLNQILQAFTTVASAPLGALAISIMPLGWALSLDVATALLAIVPLFFYTIPQKKVERLGKKSWNIGQEFKEGASIVWKDAGLLRLFLLLACVVLVIMPTFTFMPLLVKEYFGGGAPEVAIIEGLGGLGMAAGGILVVVLSPKNKMLWILWGFALSCFTLAFTALVPAQYFWFAVAWWVISGVTFIFGNAPLTSLLQTIIPNELQGRVLSLLNTIMGLAAPVGLMLATPLGDLIGIRWLFVVIGILGGLICLTGFASRSMKRLEKN